MSGVQVFNNIWWKNEWCMAWKKRPGNWLYTYDTSKLSRSPLCPLLNLALWADRRDSQYPMGPNAIHPVAQPQGSQGSCSRVYRCEGHRRGSPPANHPQTGQKGFWTWAAPVLPFSWSQRLWDQAFQTGSKMGMKIIHPSQKHEAWLGADPPSGMV